MLTSQLRLEARHRFVGGMKLNLPDARTGHAIAMCTRSRPRTLCAVRNANASHQFSTESRQIARVRRRECSRCKAVPNFNPQNVPDPQVMPSGEFGPEETVRAQLDALQNNDVPWPNHGVQTAYEFGADIGGMERSRYFGYSKDLYHFDHFLGQFQNAFPELVGLTDYTIEGTEQQPGDSYHVDVAVTKGGKATGFRFLLVRKDIGRKKGSLMTGRLTRL